MSHFLGNIGLLSGFDPQTKHVSLSYTLRTLMAAYARVNNRIVNGNTRLMSTTQTPIAADRSALGENSVSCRFLLPKTATKVIVWSLGYKLVPNGASDQLAMDPKIIRQSNVANVFPRFEEEATLDKGKVYLLTANIRDPSTIDGEYYFYVVQYELDGQTKNAYLSFFVENVADVDKRNLLLRIAEYVKFLSSSNPNYGEFFTVFAPGEGSLAAKERIPNKPLATPELSSTLTASDIDCVVPMVSRIESKSRRGGEINVSYEIAYPDDLKDVIPILLKYIKAISASGQLMLPANFRPTPEWTMTVYDTDIDQGPFAITKHSPLITIASHVFKEGRLMDRIILKDDRISRLIFGTDGVWLIPIVQGSTRFKSPGNGSILQHICVRCTDDVKIREICSQLASEVDGPYNDFLGKSTQTMEDMMITDASYVRSCNDVAFSYRQLTGIETSHAYYANYADLLRLMGSLRSPDNEYFVNVLQRPMSFTGKRRNADGHQDSTKLMAFARLDKMSRVFRDEDGQVQTVDKADGGVFIELKRKDVEENRSVLCPFSREIALANTIINAFGRNEDFILPYTMTKVGGHVSLTGLNKHTSLSVRLSKEGKLFPERANPFKGDKNALAGLVGLREETMSYLISRDFLGALASSSISLGEYRVACILANRLSKGEYVNIFGLLPYDLDDGAKSVWACPYCVAEGREAIGECTCVEIRVARLWTNVVVNCAKEYQACRRRLLMPLALLDLSKAAKDHFESGVSASLRPIDLINGFLLANDWRKPSFLGQLAMAASVLHANRKITNDELIVGHVPFTEAIWVNFGMPLVMPADNGDLLMRTMMPSLSERANAAQMLLFTRGWSFIVGSVPKTDGVGINSATSRYTMVRSGERIEYTGRAVSAAFAAGPAGVVVSGQRAFIDEIKATIASAPSGTYVRKPAMRDLIMRTLVACPERISLLMLPMSRKDERHVSLLDYFYRIHAQLPRSFVIDGRVYRTDQSKTECLNEYLDSL